MTREKMNKIVEEMINNPDKSEILDKIFYNKAKIMAKNHGNKYNLKEEKVNKKFTKSLPENINTDQMIGDLYDLGFYRGMRQVDNQKNVRWLLYNEEIEVLLALEKNGIMRYCSSYLVPQENITEILASPRIYMVDNLEDLKEQIQKIKDSKIFGIYHEELKIKDLPLLSPEEEEQISSCTQIIENISSNDNSQRKIYDIIPIIRQEIEAQKEKVYETLPFKNALQSQSKRIVKK